MFLPKLGPRGFRVPRTRRSTLCSTPNSSYDAVIVGAGHNGLVAAAYMALSGLKVGVFEKRPIVGGAAVTEEMVPGFHFSRASYVLSLLRPQIFKDLELSTRYGLKVHLRNPSSYTPMHGSDLSLTLGQCSKLNREEIGKFSHRDAEKYEEFENHLGAIVDVLDPLLDHAPLELAQFLASSLPQKMANLSQIKPLWTAFQASRKVDLQAIHEIATAPTSKILDHWFESEPLKATLATDACIGSMSSPSTPGSGYVLLHHVMGGLDGIRGAWGYPQGGMGSVSQAIANAASDAGVDIYTDSEVEAINVESGGVTGITLKKGSSVISAPLVLSNATPQVTFFHLLPRPEEHVSKQLLDRIEAIDYTSPVTKLNFAVNRLPNFKADPNLSENQPLPHHQTTIHLNCENMALLEDSYFESLTSKSYSKRPMIEMTIPSVLDPTIAPLGQHVCHVFTQYTPFDPSPNGWDPKARESYSNIIVDTIESYAPGFRESIVGYEMLTPPDLENVFGLTGGNIFHGAMALDQLYVGRPINSKEMPSPNTPISGLIMAGSGAHPGGGVMGSPGRLAAMTVVKSLGKAWRFA